MIQMSRPAPATDAHAHAVATALEVTGVTPLAPSAAAPAAAVATDRVVQMEELLQRYGRLITAMVRRVSSQGSAHLREDIQQRVLISLWKQLLRAQTIEFPAAYIYRTTVREAVRVTRQESGRAQEPIEAGEDAGGLTSPHDPHVELDRKEKMGHIRAAVEAIAPDRRQAVWAHLSGFDVTEIMDRYGWTYQKARNLVSRGMADVRRILQEGGLGPSGAPTDRPVRPRLQRDSRPPESIRESAERVRRAKLRMIRMKRPAPPAAGR
jgi:RNA polymerase sigma factor (sigma-70 family)